MNIKLIFFIPAIIFTLFYGWAVCIWAGTIHPVVIPWLLLFWLAGVLLRKNLFWGGILGMIPAACFIYMGAQETGQIMNETSVGIVILRISQEKESPEVFG